MIEVQVTEQLIFNNKSSRKGTYDKDLNKIDD